MLGNPLADEVWRGMTALVADNSDGWRRATVDRTGLPFSRIRILLRLARGSMTVTEVAHAVTIDAPAATVAVNDLEHRGLVMREMVAANRRRKMVSLTDGGWAMVATINAIDDPAPEALAALDNNELTVLRELTGRVGEHSRAQLRDRIAGSEAGC